MCGFDEKIMVVGAILTEEDLQSCIDERIRLLRDKERADQYKSDIAKYFGFATVAAMYGLLDIGKEDDY